MSDYIARLHSDSWFELAHRCKAKSFTAASEAQNHAATRLHSFWANVQLATFTRAGDEETRQPQVFSQVRESKWTVGKVRLKSSISVLSYAASLKNIKSGLLPVFCVPLAYYILCVFKYVVFLHTENAQLKKREIPVCILKLLLGLSPNADTKTMLNGVQKL